MLSTLTSWNNWIHPGGFCSIKQAPLLKSRSRDLLSRRRPTRLAPIRHLLARVLARPKPAKCASGQQAVDQSIDDFLDGHAPRLTLPDAVAQVSQTVGEKRGGASDAKDGQIVRAGRDRASSEIGDEEADNQAVDEPHAQELRHDGWAARQHGHHPDWSLLVFFH